MKIRFDSPLPHPDNGKGPKKDSRVGKQDQTDRIEISSGKKPEATYTNRVSVSRLLRNDESRIEHPTSRISRFRLYTYENITGKNKFPDLESGPRIVQPAPDRIESSPGTKPIDVPSNGGRAEKLAEVRLKIATGYYNNPEHIEQLADKLIDELHIGNERGSGDASHNR